MLKKHRYNQNLPVITGAPLHLSAGIGITCKCDWCWKYISTKTCPVEKGARLLVPLRLALLAIRRKLISGGSHNWGGGASETTNFRSWKFYLISKHFFLNFKQSWKKTKETKTKNAQKKFSGIFSYQTTTWRGAYKSFEKVSNFWFKEMKSDLERLIAARDKKTGNWILKKSQDKKWSKNFTLLLDKAKSLRSGIESYKPHSVWQLFCILFLSLMYRVQESSWHLRLKRCDFYFHKTPKWN